MAVLRNKKLESGYGGDIVIFTLGLMSIILGIRMIMEGGNWLIGTAICFGLSIPLILYGSSYRLIDKTTEVISQ